MGQINNAQKAGNLYAYNRFITQFQVDNDIRNLSFIMLYSNHWSILMFNSTQRINYKIVLIHLKIFHIKIKQNADMFMATKSVLNGCDIFWGVTIW